VKTTSPTTTPVTTTTSGSKNLAGKIAFASNDENGDLEIYVMNADGTNLKKLTNNSIGAQYPVWSPDGQRIAFAAIKDGGIYTMNADGTNLKNLFRLHS
jgi:TolB protein